jgi:hypothetical protein
MNMKVQKLKVYVWGDYDFILKDDSLHHEWRNLEEQGLV